MNYIDLTLETALAQADSDAARINAVCPPPQGICADLDAIDAILAEPEGE